MIDCIQSDFRRKWIPENHCETPLKKVLPFYQSRCGEYIHRVRSGIVYFHDGEYSHASYKLWCGMSGLTSNGVLVAIAPMGRPICATCEGRAIGAGQTESRMICGRLVKFSPRL